MIKKARECVTRMAHHHITRKSNQWTFVAYTLFGLMSDHGPAQIVAGCVLIFTTLDAIATE